MTFSATQIRQLGRKVTGSGSHSVDHLVAEANRVFGFDAWDTETIATECVWRSKLEQGFHAAYTAKVRLTVRTDDRIIAREGHGAGEARAASPGQAHALALTMAEVDALGRSLATFGKRFGRAPSQTATSVNGRGAPHVSREGRRAVAANGSPEVEERSDGSSLAPALTRIDKADLAIGEPRRRRNEDHLRHVRQQPCLVCGRSPSQAHHLRFAQPRALGRKVSDEFTVPVCSAHHDQVHRTGDEPGWWQSVGIDPIDVAANLWRETASGT